MSGNITMTIDQLRIERLEGAKQLTCTLTWESPAYK